MITITIPNNSDVATIVQRESNNINVSKTVKVKDMFNLFSSLNPVKIDTGYISPYLIREVVEDEVTRIYYMKEFTTPVIVNIPSGYHNITDQDFISNNPHNISLESTGNSYYRLKFNQFTWRDVLAITKNNNVEAFNHSSYFVGFTLPNALGQISDQSPFRIILPNHFSNYICWPRDYNVNNIVNNKDSNIQYSFITAYLSSMFNSDLSKQAISLSKAAPYIEEFFTFLNEITTKFKDTTFSRFKDWLHESRINQLDITFLFFYFICNIKKLSPLSVCNYSSNITGYINSNNRD